MSAPSALLVLSTCPQDRAAGLARLLVEEGVAACVNVLERVESFYFWEGKLNQDSESLLLIKTAPGRLEALTAAILRAHPYQVPEVIALDVVGGNPRYLEWVATSSRASRSPLGAIPSPPGTVSSPHPPPSGRRGPAGGTKSG